MSRILRKPPLDWKILSILKKHKKLNVYDLTNALEGVYRIDAVKKWMKKMEDEKLLQSHRENRIKYYSLAEKGIDEIKRMNYETNGLTEAQYYEIIYKWDKATEKGELFLNNALVENAEKRIKLLEDNEKHINDKDSEERRKILKDIRFVKNLKEHRFHGLVTKTTYNNKDKIGFVIQREAEPEKLLMERIEQIVKAGFNLKVIYVALLDTEREYKLPDKINFTIQKTDSTEQQISSTKIELFKIDAD